jgi:hypothetical protein
MNMGNHHNKIDEKPHTKTQTSCRVLWKIQFSLIMNFLKTGLTVIFLSVELFMKAKIQVLSENDV